MALKSFMVAASLGLIFVSLCNGEVVQGILQTLMEQSAVEDALSGAWLHFSAVGLGLLYLGQQGTCEGHRAERRLRELRRRGARADGAACAHGACGRSGSSASGRCGLGYRHDGHGRGDRFGDELALVGQGFDDHRSDFQRPKLTDEPSFLRVCLYLQGFAILAILGSPSWRQSGSSYSTATSRSSGLALRPCGPWRKSGFEMSSATWGLQLALRSFMVAASLGLSFVSLCNGAWLHFSAVGLGLLYLGQQGICEGLLGGLQGEFRCMQAVFRRVRGTYGLRRWLRLGRQHGCGELALQ